MNILNKNIDISPIESLMIHDGKIIPVPFESLKGFSQEMLSIFCHKHALYQLPTTELIDFLKNEIGDSSVIEIGSGNGCMGRSLGIKMADNYMQTWDDVKFTYGLTGQPTITYGSDVEELDAISAVKKYNPKTVVACWVTHKYEEGMTAGNMYGIQEELLFENGVEKYIHVGNHTNSTGHPLKPILSKYPVKMLHFPWLVSRSMSRDKNTIYIFSNK